MSDDVKTPSMQQAMLTAITPKLQPTGKHEPLPDGYCPDCQGQCLREWLPVIAKSPVVDYGDRCETTRQCRKADGHDGPHDYGLQP